MSFRKLTLAAAVAMAMGAPATVVADSEFGFGGTGTQASADLSFRIIIPDFVFFQVGTFGNGNVDRVDFDLNAGGVESGDGNAVGATGGTGDGADGILAVELRSNASNVSIAATGGNLTGQTTAGNLPFADISASDGGTITVPDFGATVNLAAGPYNLTDQWVYSYDNTSVYAPDQYDGTVTYTVTTL